MRGTSYSNVPGIVLRTTERAALYLMPNGAEVWIPHSTILGGPASDGDEDIGIADWFVEKEELL